MIFVENTADVARLPRLLIEEWAAKAFVRLHLPETDEVVIDINEIADEFGGLCDYGDDEHEWKIYISPSLLSDAEELIDTINHEMAHIKQMSSGTLWIDTFDDGVCYIWEEEVFMQDETWSQPEIYHLLPWEIEAEAFEIFMRNKRKGVDIST